jgi:hypothetical protein
MDSLNVSIAGEKKEEYRNTSINKEKGKGRCYNEWEQNEREGKTENSKHRKSEYLVRGGSKK